MSCEWFVVPPPPCSCCGRPYEPLRIGVSAIGWAFSFDVHPDHGSLDAATSKQTWLAYLADKEIEDEYGARHTLDEFVAFVERKEGLKRAARATVG